MGKRAIEHLEHTDKERPNNPEVGLVTPLTDPDAGGKTYAHDPHLDPELSWCGKAENTSFEVPTVSLHVHERIEPRTIIEAVRKGNGRPEDQLSFFARSPPPEENRPLREAIDFYRHRRNWSNRLIAGDSLLVMNSLLEKEGLGGQVQMVYIDPPYGINYGSNFQPFVNKRDVPSGDKDEDLTTEPEQIRAFRDTWELGIHSYLSCLRDRLLLARELLHESGSCFVQIGDENVHLLGAVMDEIFGPKNRVATIAYVTTGSSSANTLPEVADYLLWYAKDKNQVKYRQLYEPLTRSEVIKHFNWDVMIELPGGQSRKPTPEERFDPDKHLPKNARIYRRMNLFSRGASSTGRSDPYEYDGRVLYFRKKPSMASLPGRIRPPRRTRSAGSHGRARIVGVETVRRGGSRPANSQRMVHSGVGEEQRLRRPDRGEGDTALHPDDHRPGRPGLRPHLRRGHYRLRR